MTTRWLLVMQTFRFHLMKLLATIHNSAITTSNLVQTNTNFNMSIWERQWRKNMRLGVTPKISFKLNTKTKIQFQTKMSRIIACIRPLIHQIKEGLNTKMKIKTYQTLTRTAIWLKTLQQTPKNLAQISKLNTSNSIWLIKNVNQYP